MSELATAAPQTPPSMHVDAAGPESMVKITPTAATKINEIREAEGIEPTMALRLRVVGGGCAGFSYDLYFDDGTEVDRGVEIDYVEGLQGAGFKFNNPNVKSTCGCGSSFSV